MADDNSGEMEKLNAIMLEKQKELVNLAHAKKDYDLLADSFQGAPQELTEYDELMVRKYIDQIKIYEDYFTVCFKAKVKIDIQR